MCRTKFDEFLFLLPFPDLSHESAVLFFPWVSLLSFTSLLPVKCGILHRTQGFSSSSKQAGGLPRNSPESKAGGKLDESKQAKAISDEQGGIPGWGTTAVPPKHTSDGHHAQTDTAECSGKFPFTEIEISDSNPAGLTAPLLTVRRDTELHRLSPHPVPVPALGFWGVSGF